MHEKWNIAKFISGNTISIQPFYVGTEKSKTNLPSKLEFHVDEVIHFETFNTYIEPNLENRRRLYVPTDRKHPAWDCIYDDGSTTAFFQFSISPYWEGHYQKVEKSFGLKKPATDGTNHIFYSKLISNNSQ